MNELCPELTEALSVLAAIVNRAGRAEPTSAEAIKVAKVPLGLLYDAKRILARLADTEYGTDAARQAARRVFE